MTEQAIKKSGYAQQILRSALVNKGARLGLYWITFLIVIAVFAPLIANSHPLLLSQNNSISSPLIHNLSNLDIGLFIVFLTFVLLWFLKIQFKSKVYIFLSSILVSVVIGLTFSPPPHLTVYEQYRESEKIKDYDWVVRTPIVFSPKDYLRDYGDTGLEEPFFAKNRMHLFGTNVNGADVFSRMVYATRIALGIGFIATGIAMLIGIIIGGLMGFYSGVIDMFGMRLVEIFEAIPTLFLLLTFVAFFGRSLYLLMVIIGLTSWSGYARFVRAEFLRLREQEFVQSAIACGLPTRSILFRHMLPNGIAPILVAASFGVASAILAEATLSFLGLGLVDDPSWGQMLNQAVQSSTFYWWMAVFPGGAIFLTVFTYNLLGEALRDAIDPNLKKS
ncbi:Dipeptide transport system permease protein DppC (TC 3.A.1.5.2) [hydrothermal vent metagenome]|uniref:Dipeptide transport system permease protein DppC (TC 3.A.1.5.2) n=1 Tax=hydrothermal vent metagenome TaxID=652676 RepID=A0A3B1AKA2_9ZZZZ